MNQFFQNVINVRIYLKETSQPIEFKTATSTYQKGDFFCVFLAKENKVYKYPLANIFNVREDYMAIKQRSEAVAKRK